MADHGPFDTERQARRYLAAHPAYAAAGASAGQDEAATVMLDACRDAGVELGKFDRLVLRWLASNEPEDVAVIVAIIRRATQLPAGIFTRWGVRLSDGTVTTGQTEREMRDFAVLLDEPGAPVAVVSCLMTPWTTTAAKADSNG